MMVIIVMMVVVEVMKNGPTQLKGSFIFKSLMMKAFDLLGTFPKRPTRTF